MGGWREEVEKRKKESPTHPPTHPPYLAHLTELLPRLFPQFMRSSTDKEVWYEAESPHLTDGVLGGLGFLLAADCG